MFKFACADFTYPLLTHDQVLKLISLLEFDGVDIGLFENRSHIQPSQVFPDAAGQGRLLKQKVDDLGIRVADVFLQCDTDFYPKAINHPDQAVRTAVRNDFEHLLEYALAAGSRHVTCLPGVVFENEEQDYRRAVDELVWRVEAARSQGLIFAVEAHLGSIVDTPEKALKLVKDTAGLTLTLDYTHFTKIGIPDKDVEPLIAHASHFHARGAARDQLQTVFSENTIDYPRIVRQMQKTGYDGYIGIEYIWMEWENCNRSDNISETILLMNTIREAAAS